MVPSVNIETSSVEGVDLVQQLWSLFSLWVAYRHWADYCPKAKRRSPKVWMLVYLKKCPTHSQHFTLMQDFRNLTSYGPTRLFQNTWGVDVEMYDFMCNRLNHLIASKTTNYQKPITTIERLSITLNFLTTGAQYNLIRNGYVAAKPSVSKIVGETCAAIIEEFQDEVFHTPSTEPEWKAIADRFLDRLDPTFTVIIEFEYF